MSNGSMGDFERAVEGVSILRKRLLQIIDDNDKYTDVDARGIGLLNCSQKCLCARMIMNLLHNATLPRGLIEHIPTLLGLRPAELEDAGAELEFFARVSYVVGFQFQIENLLKNLLVEIDGPEQPMGCYRIANKILELLGVDDLSNKLKTLNTHAWIRNSLHGNGIHSRDSEDVVVNGVTYSFTNDEVVTCADWDRVIHLQNAVINIIEEILYSDKIGPIEGPIKDPYVWKKAGLC